MIEQIQAYLLGLATDIPLDVFAFIASFLEEIIAPIPSPLIGTLLGSLAANSGYGLITSIVILGAVAAIGKTFACMIIYWVVRKLGNAVVEKFGKYVGVRQDDIVAISSYFTGTVRDYFILILIRAVPFIPSLPVSIGAGLLKTPFKFYVIGTLIGSFIRTALFIFVGYAGLSAYFTLVDRFGAIESFVLVAFAVLALGFLLWLYVQQLRKKR